MPAPTHPNKRIRAAVAYAAGRGWRLVRSNGHAWGRLFCPAGVRGGHKISVYSTPRNPERHAREIRAVVDACDHAPAA